MRNIITQLRHRALDYEIAAEYRASSEEEYSRNQGQALGIKEAVALIEAEHIQNVVEALDSWGKIARDERNGFIERFCSEAVALLEVSWDSENMRIVYVSESEEHIAETFKMSEWADFLKGVYQTPRQ